MATAGDGRVAALYQSLPLPRGSRSIRVLDVQGSSPSDYDGGPMTTSLRVAGLDQQLEFTALSYVWGPKATGSYLIACNGVTLAVTGSCYAALKHLKRKLAAFTIWIDAICINQKDDTERSHQVTLMGDIYSRASTVYVWLGEGTEGTDRAMAYLATAGLLSYFTSNGEPNGKRFRISRHWCAFWNSYSARWSRTSYPMPLCTSAAIPKRGYFGIPYINTRAPLHTISATLDDISALLSTQWNNRIWTYQEILFAQNGVIVRGNAHISWSRFAYSIVFLNALPLMPISIPSLASWKRIAQMRTRFVSSRDCSQQDLHANLQAYELFVHRIARLSSRLSRNFCFSLIGLPLLIAPAVYVIFAPFMPLSHNRRWYITAIIILVFSLYSLILLQHFFVRRIVEFPDERVSEFNRYSVSYAKDDIVDVISTRKVSDSKDKAFAVQSVLEQMLSRKLPAPNYVLPNERIYEKLTHDVMDATKSLQALLPAAVQHFSGPGEASWVADWSCENIEWWMGDTAQDLHASYAVLNGDEPSFGWGRTSGTSLVLRAYVVGTVEKCWGLEELNDRYDSRKGLGALGDLYNLLDVLVKEQQQRRMLPFRNLLGESILSRGPSDAANGDSEALHQLPGRLQTYLRTGYIGKRLFHKRYRAKLEACLCINTLLRSGNQLFTNDKESGFCTRNARAGDRIMMVTGVRLPLIVRDRGDGDGSVSLVSPMVMAWTDRQWQWRHVRRAKGKMMEVRVR